MTQATIVEEGDGMATPEERMRILKMIDDGKISGEEGAKLLAALGGDRSGAGKGESERRNRWLRIKVTDLRTGRSKANVTIPLGLLDAGLRIGAHYAPEVGGVDLEDLRTAIRSGLTGKLVDVTDDEDGEHVEIYVD